MAPTVIRLNQASRGLEPCVPHCPKIQLYFISAIPRRGQFGRFREKVTEPLWKRYSVPTLREFLAQRIERRMAPTEVAVAALYALPYLGIVLALHFLDPPNLLEQMQADPLLKPLQNMLGSFAVPILSVAAIAGWYGSQKPGLADLRGAEYDALSGAVLAIGATLLLRAVVGENMPAFIPPEESAKPGMMQGLSAGLIEEILFRLGTLPLAYFGLRKTLGEQRAKLAAIVITGLLFALSHELTGASFHGQLFATRTILPGCVMSVLFFAVSPTFIVALHCTAHLMIPFLFR